MTKDSPSTVQLFKPSTVPGVKCLIFGEAGTGKTYSTRTLFDIDGIQPVHFFFDPSMTTISGFPQAKWAYIDPTGDGDASSLKAILEIGKRINTMGNADLQKEGIGSKRDFTQWLAMIDKLNHFVTAEGEDLGDSELWGTDHVLILDNLTDITRMARRLQSGNKPLLTQPDYGVIMQNIEFFLEILTHKFWCHVILLAHIEVEKDEIGGGLLKSVATIGRKLPPKIPPLFDDVFQAKREGGQFIWSTYETDATTKNRNMPLGQAFKQDFSLLFDTWRANGGTFAPGRPASTVA